MLYDCVIVGGGAVGASLALALGQQKYKVLLLEKNAQFSNESDTDARTIALSYASLQIYRQMNVWEKLIARAIPIQKVLVTVQGQYGTCRLESEKQGVAALGYVVGLRELEQALYEALSAEPNVQILRPATLVYRSCAPDAWHLKIQQAHENLTVKCKLLIAADGVMSHLRQEQSIPQLKKEYEHYAVMANIQIVSKQPFTAYERFLPQGAIALLPWQKDLYTCIWTTSCEEAEMLVQLNSAQFLQKCQRQWGSRIGLMQAVSKRNYFPLQMQLASQQESARFLLMGNAAHSLHPIAAQGLNLSLRDIWQMRSQIIKASETVDIGSAIFLNEYTQARKTDQNRIIFATDVIARTMSSGLMPGWMKAAGITLFDCLSPLKNKFTRMGMGLT